jgi:hypothetical protein
MEHKYVKSGGAPSSYRKASGPRGESADTEFFFAD